MSQMIKRLGALTGLGMTAWSLGQLLKAELDFPQAGSSSKIGSGSNPDPCNWLNLAVCKINFTKHADLESALHDLSPIDPDRSKALDLIEQAIRNGDGEIKAYETLTGPRPGTAYRMTSVINGVEVNIRFTAFGTGEIEVLTVFIP